MSNIFYEDVLVKKEEREKLLNQQGKILWITGLSGSGKSTLGKAVERKLYEGGYLTYLIDGDNLRLGLNSDLDFSKENRKENIRRVGELIEILLDLGVIVIVTLVSPFREQREEIKKRFKESFVEIFINTPIEVCEARDCKGLYKLAREGRIKEFTGVSSPYEKPLNPDIELIGLEEYFELNMEKILKEILYES